MDVEPEMRLAAAADHFAEVATRPASTVGSLHDMIVAMHQVCGALAFAIERQIPDKRIQELALRARETAALSPFVSRLQAWPRGYPGDFETIEYILAQQNRATPGTAAYLIEHHSLTSAIVQQHRNKVLRQAQMIAEHADAQHQARILVLAAGSTPDIALVLGLLARSSARVVIVDSDPEAIEFSHARLGRLGSNLEVVAQNVLKAAPTLREGEPFDLVLAGGLFDYLPSKHAAALIRDVSGLLRPHGTFFFTNMIDPNPYRGWMRYVANWRVIERTADEIHALVEKGAPGRFSISIEVDGTGLALLVSCKLVVGA